MKDRGCDHDLRWISSAEREVGDGITAVVQLVGFTQTKRGITGFLPLELDLWQAHLDLHECLIAVAIG